jgi:hypothetical protein
MLYSVKMDEYVRIWVETDVTYLKVLSKHLSGDTDRNHEKVSEPAVRASNPTKIRSEYLQTANSERYYSNWPALWRGDSKILAGEVVVCENNYSLKASLE